MIERAELCVQRNSTLKAGVTTSSSGASSGSKPREIAAKFGATAAAGLGQEAEQVSQPGEPDGIDDLPALPRRLDEPGPFQCRQVKRQARRRRAQSRRQFSGRHAGGAGRRQQAHQVEPFRLGERREPVGCV